MTDLRAAAQQALEALEGGADSWQRVGPAIDALKAALAEPVQEPQGCDHCNSPLYAATKCRVCGRATEPVQEPVAWSHNLIDNIITHRPADIDRHPDRWTPLYTSPPQRKPLAEWQINDLMADIDPEDRDSWPFRQGVYAAEKHHGVRK